MRKASDRKLQNLPVVSTRALRFSVVAIGIGLVMSAGMARAQEDEEDNRSFEEKIMDNVMSGIGATNMENKGIDYRERSPLVVPPRLDLPPPVSVTAEPKIANWPKDPDERRRKAALTERKKASHDITQTNMPVPRADLDVAKPGDRAASNDPSDPGHPLNNGVVDLGINSSSIKNMFGSATEIKQFKGEPTRESLTQPPVGYQTPSPNYAYGVGPKDTMNRQSDPLADSVAGKYGN
jgi:hypothetical protein